MSSDEFLKTLFRDTPGPSPWYLRPDDSVIEGFRWQHGDSENPLAAGKTLLVGANGPVLVLDFQNYVMRLNESTLLIWNQPKRQINDLASLPVSLSIIEPHNLNPLDDDLNSVFKRMRSQGVRLTIGGKISAKMDLPTSNVTDQLHADFPPQLQSVDELLILCHSSGIEARDHSADLALLLAHPRTSEFQLYPQDWFNYGDFDFGYEWVTRVAHDPQTSKIHGEGIRIRPFVLDDSLRKCRTIFSW